MRAHINIENFHQKNSGFRYTLKIKISIFFSRRELLVRVGAKLSTGQFPLLLRRYLGASIVVCECEVCGETLLEISSAYKKINITKKCLFNLRWICFRLVPRPIWSRVSGFWSDFPFLINIWANLKKKKREISCDSG